MFHSNLSNSSREYEQSAPAEISSGAAEEIKTPEPPADKYEDLQKIIHDQMLNIDLDNRIIIPPSRDLNVLRPENPTIGEMEDLEPRYV